jgi:hypothetical protein
MRSDLIFLGNLYTQILERLDEPKFVQQRPHPIQPMEGEIGVNHIGPNPDDPEMKFIAAAKMIINHILKNDHNINMAVLKRDDFPNNNMNEYADAVDRLVEMIKSNGHDEEAIHNTAREYVKKFANKLKKDMETITNRLDYNKKGEQSNLGVMHNNNANLAPARQQYGGY